MRRCLKLMSFFPLMVASACTMSGEGSRPSEPPVSAVPPVEGRGPQRVPPSQAVPSGVSSAVPADVIARVREDLAKRTGADASVVSAQAVEWPDGSLGCPEPGQMYTQAIVPGYRIELESGGKRYAYHASQKGYFKLCQNAGGVNPLPTR